MLKGGPVVGPHLKLLGQYFLGYTVTFEGSLIGLAYGFGLGFCLGYLVARIYNWLVDAKDRRQRRQVRESLAWVPVLKRDNADGASLEIFQ